MEGFQQRVIDERRELDDKLKNLSEFLGSNVFSNLPEDERMRLKRQYGIMKDYSKVLFERIAAFK